MSDSTPICRCRVLYLGSSVPQQTKDGLQGIQEPLQELYPEQGATTAKGIDSWLSVWSNGILLENVDENRKEVTRFFPIESLHYCAAVRYVLVPEKNSNLQHTPTARFLPLDSPFARTPNPAHPPLFAAILRRTTGIKVLECHAFICKREVAANALVRCCFHAYADSSYAKQVDTAGSIYGTLASERLTSKEKIDEWKMSRSQSGSTLTLNTITKDDVSIYNGDENHKVWAGSQDNLDGSANGGVYDTYAASTVSRPSARPRQVAGPVAVPPPPPPPQQQEKGKKKKEGKNKKSSQSLSGSREDLYYSMTNGKASSVAGSLARPRAMPPGPLPPGPQPIYIMAPHPGTLPNPKFFKTYGNTFSHRPRGKFLIPARPVPPPMVPVAPVILPPTTLQKPKKSKKYQPPPAALITAEEPVYMPSHRAMSPIASYQPITFPHEAYLMQQYATVESQSRQRRREKQAAAAAVAVMAAQQEKQAKINKKLTQSMNGLDDPNLGSDESPFNTGIYRKKGHLNERAFSYSIRQEHRSRSYGSLANLKFASPIPNGHDVEDREDIKKEREIMQLVQDLDLSEDELERSEVPRGMYDVRAAPPPGPVVIQATHMNGHGRGHRR
ncbi:unnamed protein product [Callosobruchus maculatus]|uniref:PID domain-containing protein n=1 Tax=Callosobruchus maculatus TaxID=64391 RepID=A0A653CDT1_CALMS|nr:unnamed protein product [Callosobruchus maculatus]